MLSFLGFVHGASSSERKAFGLQSLIRKVCVQIFLLICYNTNPCQINLCDNRSYPQRCDWFSLIINAYSLTAFQICIRNVIINLDMQFRDLCLFPLITLKLTFSPFFFSDVAWWKQGFIRTIPILHCISQLGENKGGRGHWVLQNCVSGSLCANTC